MIPLRIALIGCGSFQNAHALRVKENPDAEIVALYDVSNEQADKLINNSLKDQDPSPTFFADIDTMYKDAELDAVFIATPHTTHFEHCMRALEVGCHVYVEKPMVTNADHAHELAEKVQQSERILVIGYNTPCMPECEYLREQIRQKTFGRLELVVGHLSQDWVRATKGTWRQQPELSGGGQAYDSGAHIFNTLVWCVESNVREVFAFVDHLDTPVDVNSSINIRFENGVLASVVIGGNCPTSAGHLAFMFDRGKIETDGWGGTWINVFDEKGRVKYPPIKGKQQWPDDNFIDAILGRAKPRTSPQNGIVQSELMDAIYESERTGQPARPKRR